MSANRSLIDPEPFNPCLTQVPDNARGHLAADRELRLKYAETLALGRGDIDILSVGYLGIPYVASGAMSTFQRPLPSFWILVDWRIGCLLTRGGHSDPGRL